MEEKFEKISNFIVDKRNLFICLFLVISVISFFTIGLTKINNDLLTYLADDSLTKTGLEVMDLEFDADIGTTAKVMISDIKLEEVPEIFEKLSEYEGVFIEFDEDSNYVNEHVLFYITFENEDNEEVILDKIREDFSESNINISSSSYGGGIDSLNKDMAIILGIVVVLIIIIVGFTSKSFAEIPILFIVFIVAAVVNMGTNFILVEISFLTNAVAVILQLALAIDYALIFIHRFALERESKECIIACKDALCKAIPEVLSSSLTTIFSLIALSFMTFKIGEDLSFVLIKAIVISLFVVFTLMPGLIILFSDFIDKSKHKNYIPNIDFIGELAIKSRYVVLPLFLIITVLASVFSYRTNYEFFEDGKTLEYKEMGDKIDSIFGTSNPFIMLVSNEEDSSEFILKLSEIEGVNKVVDFSTYELLESLTVSSLINYEAAANIFGVDEKLALNIFDSYAIFNEEEDIFIKNNEIYVVSVYDLIYFMNDYIESMSVSDDLKEMIVTYYTIINTLENTFISENYNRIMVDTDFDIEGAETFGFVDSLIELKDEYLIESYVIGNSINSYELSNAFNIDNKLIGILSVVFIFFILMFTFKSVITSISMILIIQSAIFMNFAFPYVTGVSLYFIGYLIVSAIQMGANIDYAIVITNRYKTMCESMSYKEAIKVALNEAFPTIITSGSILAISGFVLYNVSSNMIISTLGLCIGRGTLISMCLVLFVLPQLLYIESTICEKIKK